MTVKELIAQLEKQPQGANVMKSNSDGCPECNPEGLPYHHDVYDTKFLLKGEYPNEKDTKVVVL